MMSICPHCSTVWGVWEGNHGNLISQFPTKVRETNSLHRKPFSRNIFQMRLQFCNCNTCVQKDKNFNKNFAKLTSLDNF